MYKICIFLCYMFVLDVNSYHIPQMKAEVLTKTSGFDILYMYPGVSIGFLSRQQKLQNRGLMLNFNFNSVINFRESRRRI